MCTLLPPRQPTRHLWRPSRSLLTIVLLLAISSPQRDTLFSSILNVFSLSNFSLLDLFSFLVIFFLWVWSFISLLLYSMSVLPLLGDFLCFPPSKLIFGTMPIITRDNKRGILKFILDHTQPKKTIQNVAQSYRTKEDNTVLQQYKPLKDLTRLYNNKRLYRTIQGCTGEKGLRKITSYLLEDLRQITSYLPEDLRKITSYLPEDLR